MLVRINRQLAIVSRLLCLKSRIMVLLRVVEVTSSLQLGIIVRYICAIARILSLWNIDVVGILLRKLSGNLVGKLLARSGSVSKVRGHGGTLTKLLHLLSLVVGLRIIRQRIVKVAQIEWPCWRCSMTKML